MVWLYWCTNWLLGGDSSDFVSAIHTISIFPSTILSKSPTLFLMELIFRYEKIILLRSECRERFKVTLIFSSYSWLVIDASRRGLIYLLNMRSTRFSLEKNDYDSIKCPINLLLMRMLTQRVEKQPGFHFFFFFFCDFKVSLLMS